MAQHEKLENSKYCKNIIKKLKLLYIYIWKNMIWSAILCEKSEFPQPVICKVVFDVVRHIERQK